MRYERISYILSFLIALTIGTALIHNFSDMAHACDYYVNDSVVDGDPGSLRDAIEQANASADYNVIKLQPGTYKLTLGQLEIKHDLSIIGCGTEKSIIDGCKNDRVFFITNAQNPMIRVKFERLTITGGEIINESKDSFGGGIYNEGNLILKNTKITNNSVESYERASGGGIFNSGDNSKLKILNSLISNNSSYSCYCNEAYGGGVSSDNINASMTIIKSCIIKNIVEGGAYSFTYGGGIYNGGILLVQDSSISENDNFGDYTLGGGIFSAGKATIIRTKIVSNCVNGGDLACGGGIDTDGNCTLVGSIVADNMVTGICALGGGIDDTFGKYLILLNSRIVGNSIDALSDALGGGIEFWSSSNKKGVIINSKISSNTANGSWVAWGGGIDMRSIRSSLLLYYSKVIRNTANTYNIPDANDDGPEGGGIRMLTDTVYKTRSSVVCCNSPNDVYLGEIR